VSVSVRYCTSSAKGKVKLFIVLMQSREKQAMLAVASLDFQ